MTRFDDVVTDMADVLGPALQALDGAASEMALPAQQRSHRAAARGALSSCGPTHGTRPHRMRRAYGTRRTCPHSMAGRSQASSSQRSNGPLPTRRVGRAASSLPWRIGHCSTKRGVVARGGDRIELPFVAFSPCGRAVLATNRQPVQRDASGLATSRKRETRRYGVFAGTFCEDRYAARTLDLLRILKQKPVQEYVDLQGFPSAAGTLDPRPSASLSRPPRVWEKHRFAGLLKRLKGLEPSTFCMARDAMARFIRFPPANEPVPDFGTAGDWPRFVVFFRGCVNQSSTGDTAGSRPSRVTPLGVWLVGDVLRTPH